MLLKRRFVYDKVENIVGKRENAGPPKISKAVIWSH